MNNSESFFISICLLSVLLLIGKFIRTKQKIFQEFYIPSSIIAGFLGIILGPYCLDIIPVWIMNNLHPLPMILINIVFAALFLGVKIPNLKKIWQKSGPFLCYGTIVGAGQYFFALLVTVFVLVPFYKVPAIFGCILEIGFSGGHGTAAGMSTYFNKIGYPAGGPLSQTSATVGVFFAIIMGIVLINIAIKKGNTKFVNIENGIADHKKTGYIPQKKRYSIATATVANESIEPLTFHFSIIGLSIVIGWIILKLLRIKFPFMDTFPLFPLAMLGGIIVQKCSEKISLDMYYDKKTFDRIMGFALDFLIVSAIASIKVDVIIKNLIPFSILMAVGMLWVLFMTVFVAPKMFPKFWFERSITEFGMQTGVTAIGLILLQLVDPESKSDSLEAFGFKQILYEPFLGGGIVTVLAPMFIIKFGIWLTILISFLIMILFLMISVMSNWTSFLAKK